MKIKILFTSILVISAPIFSIISRGGSHSNVRPQSAAVHPSSLQPTAQPSTPSTPSSSPITTIQDLKDAVTSGRVPVAEAAAAVQQAAQELAQGQQANPNLVAVVKGTAGASYTPGSSSSSSSKKMGRLGRK